jgi:hypothetical protein
MRLGGNMRRCEFITFVGEVAGEAVLFSRKRGEMRSGRAGTYLALAAGMMLATISNANADACWDHWKAKLNAQAAAGWKLVKLLKETGDCSYIPKLVADLHKSQAIIRAIPCENMNKNYGLSDDAERAKWSRYCRPQAPKNQHQQVAETPQNTPPAPAPSAAPASTPGQQPSANSVASALKKPDAKEPEATSQAAAPAPAAKPEERKTASATPAPNPVDGSCSTITGLPGGSPPPGNCSSNGVPPNIQAQINQAQSSMQQANQLRQVDPNYDNKSKTVEALFRAAAAFQAAGDLAQAADAAEQAQPLVDELKNDFASNAGPPYAPAANWLGTENAEYCANANSVERGSAYYGYVCFPNTYSTEHLSDKDRKTACAQALEILTPHKISDAWLADQMAKPPLSCNPDGSLMTLRQIIAWHLAHNHRDE